MRQASGRIMSASEPDHWQFELGGDGLGAAGVLFGLGKSELKTRRRLWWWQRGSARTARTAATACVTCTVVLYLYVGESRMSGCWIIGADDVGWSSGQLGEPFPPVTKVVSVATLSRVMLVRAVLIV
ncbi:hypothetical protein DFH94DRAFT_846074 [Russula ochroleuca]|uniref:Uncharacterized protein n=1 Tax=Russula ochroleuca TaxID=152965 RepID=A0A9P5MSL8_9AGAM|nr:hypothetical protein DFH94DRAFT_846074 [Russula ochroleuca]